MTVPMSETSTGAGAAGASLPLGHFVVDFGSDTLRDASGRVVELRPRAWAVLRHLALNAGRLVDKDSLMQAVWPALVVTDASLTQAVFEVREAIGDADHRLLKTVPRRGYILVVDAPVRSLHGGAGDDGTQHEADRPSIAVLPFRGSCGADGDVLALGIARDLVAELARNADLRVSSHHASFAVAGTVATPAELGERLRSRFLVDGAVRRDGEILRVGVELIEAASGRVVWASQHEAAAAEVPVLRDALMRRIAGTISGKTRYLERRALARPPRTLDVYALTVRGIMLVTRFDAASWREARTLLLRAVSDDPDYAPAWAWQGYLNAHDVNQGLTGEWDLRRLPDCAASLRRAIELDPDLPVVYRALALAHRLGRNYEAGLSAAAHALELAPSSAECFMMLSQAQVSLGDLRTALTTGEAGLAIDAVPTAWLMALHAQVVWACGRLRHALELADHVLVTSPQNPIALTTRVYALVELGFLNEARRCALLLRAVRHGLNAVQAQDRYADAAVDLRSRVAAICETVGIPREAQLESGDAASPAS